MNNHPVIFTATLDRAKLTVVGESHDSPLDDNFLSTFVNDLRDQKLGSPHILVEIVNSSVDAPLSISDFDPDAFVRDAVHYLSPVNFFCIAADQGVTFGAGETIQMYDLRLSNVKVASAEFDTTNVTWFSEFSKSWKKQLEHAKTVLPPAFSTRVRTLLHQMHEALNKDTTCQVINGLLLILNKSWMSIADFSLLYHVRELISSQPDATMYAFVGRDHVPNTVQIFCKEFNSCP